MGILDIVKDECTVENQEPNSHIIVPTAGFCAKFRTEGHEKVFVNVCTSEKVPKPKDISDDELRNILSDLENSAPFKIPMSIGELHVELDAGKKACSVYDVIINTEFYLKVKSSELFEAFLMTVIFEGLENKYNLILERNWVILKNKKCMGRLQEQFVRAAKRPAIIEMENSFQTDSKMIHEVNDIKSEAPNYRLSLVPDNQNPLHLVVHIELPKILTSNGVELQVGYDQLSLTSRSRVYALQIGLQAAVDEENTVAVFNRDLKILTVTMPILLNCKHKDLIESESTI